MAIVAARSPLHTVSQPESTQAQETETGPGGLDNGIKIGVIVSMTAIAILTLMTLIMCILSMRRRVQKRNAEAAQRAQQHDPEFHIMGDEPSSSSSDLRAYQREKRQTAGGLWDKLRFPPVNNEQRAAELQTRAEESNSGSRDAQAQQDGGVRSSTGEGSRLGPRTTWRYSSFSGHSDQLPAYTPRERASTLSSVASVGFTIFTKPRSSSSSSVPRKW
ncbi:hypothetical protein BS50DRAFT_79438 [Corynespora cassiicola Philippines]|uniref:Uncharacterized protein n=1 Tax=Corynespora cassiicola Philippines TaxID=1448308 RepID=A0A2T2NHE4_CORCC|nr:hypothetical protein BS50DRAFT_79438 [Corynespora cassiicola Philippines]